jgi:hypothetical protein
MHQSWFWWFLGEIFSNVLGVYGVNNFQKFSHKICPNNAKIRPPSHHPPPPP